MMESQSHWKDLVNLGQHERHPAHYLLHLPPVIRSHGRVYSFSGIDYKVSRPHIVGGL